MNTRSICFCLSLELGKALVRPVAYFIVDFSDHAGVLGAGVFAYCLYLAENEVDPREAVGLFQGSRGNCKSNLHLGVRIPSPGLFPKELPSEEGLRIRT